MLSKRDILVVVNDYIGVSGGYLGDFSYHTHAEFYPQYCDLDYDPNEIEGTTRERFIHILTNAPPQDQAKILKGVLARFPVESSPVRQKAAEKIGEMVQRLDGVAVPAPALANTREVVEHALRDAQAAVDAGRPASAVDRLHTALHAYARDLATTHGIPLPADASLPHVFGALRRHPRLAAAHPTTEKIGKALGAIVDAMNDARNRASVAHPNELLDRADALLIVNSARALLAYLEARFGSP